MKRVASQLLLNNKEGNISFKQTRYCFTTMTIISYRALYHIELFLWEIIPRIDHSTWTMAFFHFISAATHQLHGVTEAIVAMTSTLD